MAKRAINIALVGKTGNGKSSSANTITYEKDKNPLFKTSMNQGSCTMNNMNLMREIRGRKVRLTDTPGAKHTDMGEHILAKEIYSLVDLNDEGIDIFLVTFKYNSDGLVEDERKTLQLLERVFGKTTFFDHVIFLFTHGDDFDKAQEGRTKMGLGTFTFSEEITKDMFSSVKEEAVGPVMKQANSRFLLFHNKSDEKKIEMQENLMEMIDEIMKKDNYTPYTRDLLPPESALPKPPGWFSRLKSWLFSVYQANFY